jgi:hypothetical protein
MLTVAFASNVSGIDPPVENVRVPVWPSRSGRFPNVMAISGAVPSGHSGATSIANGVGVGNVVVLPAVVVGPTDVVVEPSVVVGRTVVVVVPGCVVVVADVVVVVEGVVVDVVATAVVEVGGVTLGHWSTPGSGWPMSKAMTTERPWRSWKNWPITGGPLSALTDTEIGFCPVCKRSSTPGVPTYLQTNTLRDSATDVVVVARCVVVGATIVVVAR